MLRLGRGVAAGCAGLALAAALACGGEAPPVDEPAAETTESVPRIEASNAFYYYEDVDAAWAFYTDVLGVETAADYGFAKILRIAPASYLTLVDAAEGMHSAEEPKTATLAIVTDEVEAWFEYLNAAGVPMRADLGEVDPAAAHVGFVAIDPEGYFLEFERFQPHPENELLMPVLDAIEPLYPGRGALDSRPAALGIRATVQWLYFRDTSATNSFYERLLGEPAMVDQGWAWMFPVSTTGFLGVVDGERGLHQATDDKGVTMSFIVDDIEAWFEHLGSVEGFRWRTEDIGDESGRVRVVVGYDPEGYYLEWDEFLPVSDNETLAGQLDRN